MTPVTTSTDLYVIRHGDGRFISMDSSGYPFWTDSISGAEFFNMDEHLVETVANMDATDKNGITPIIQELRLGPTMFPETVEIMVTKRVRAVALAKLTTLEKKALGVLTCPVC